MNAAEIFNQVTNQKGFDIIEGEHAIDGSSDSVTFDYQNKNMEAHGHYGHCNGKLDFLVVYSFENEFFDIEHVCENGKERVNFENITPYQGCFHVEDDVINKIEIICPETREVKYRLIQNGTRFLDVP